MDTWLVVSTQLKNMSQWVQSSKVYIYIYKGRVEINNHGSFQNNSLHILTPASTQNSRGDSLCVFASEFPCILLLRHLRPREAKGQKSSWPSRRGMGTKEDKQNPKSHGRQKETTGLRTEILLAKDRFYARIESPSQQSCFKKSYPTVVHSASSPRSFSPSAAVLLPHSWSRPRHIR